MDDKERLANMAGYPCVKIEWDDRLRKEVPSRPAVNCDHVACKYCAWNPKVAAQRARLPLTLCSDGLRRKIIPPRQRTVEDEETEVKADG